jgi:hypothetical protein
MAAGSALSAEGARLKPAAIEKPVDAALVSAFMMLDHLASIRR